MIDNVYLALFGIECFKIAFWPDLFDWFDGS